MKDKICIRKPTAVIVAIVVMIGIFTFFTLQLTKKTNTTNTRAEVPEDNLEIIGGERAGEYEFPFFASIYSSAGHQICGGALISEEWVITADHCLTGTEESNRGPFEVVIGADEVKIDVMSSQFTDLIKPKELRGLHYSRVDNIIHHESGILEWATHEDDIALLHLKDRATRVPTLSLYNPVNNVFLENIGTNQLATTMGFGATKNFGKDNSPFLKKLKLQIQKNNGGKTFTIFKDSLEETAPGDSGSPVIFTYNGSSYLLGLNVAGSKAVPNIVVSASSHYVWINKYTSIVANSGSYMKPQKYDESTYLIKKVMPVCSNLTSDDCRKKPYLCYLNSKNECHYEPVH